MAIVGHLTTVSVATGASATYTTLGGVMTFSSNKAKELLDTTDFMDGNTRRRMVGLSDFTAKLEGRLEKADEGYLRVIACHRNEQVLYAQVLYNGTNGFMAPLLIKSRVESATVDTEVKVVIDLESNGEFEVVDI